MRERQSENRQTGKTRPKRAEIRVMQRSEVSNGRNARNEEWAYSACVRAAMSGASVREVWTSAQRCVRAREWTASNCSSRVLVRVRACLRAHMCTRACARA
eukprot:6180837-Pleurochrysis_carterae.AAC.1